LQFRLEQDRIIDRSQIDKNVKDRRSNKWRIVASILQQQNQSYIKVWNPINSEQRTKGA